MSLPALPVLVSRIVPAVVGDLVSLPDHPREHAAERCAYPLQLTHAYACLSCRQLLANALQLHFHVNDTAGHVIARRCPEHGWEAL